MHVHQTVKSHVQKDACHNVQRVVVKDVTLMHVNKNVQKDAQMTVELQEGLRVDMRALMVALKTVCMIAKMHVVQQ